MVGATTKLTLTVLRTKLFTIIFHDECKLKHILKTTFYLYMYDRTWTNLNLQSWYLVDQFNDACKYNTKFIHLTIVFVVNSFCYNNVNVIMDKWQFIVYSVKYLLIPKNALSMREIKKKYNTHHNDFFYWQYWPQLLTIRQPGINYCLFGHP